jgi:hypothetical protein
MKLHELLSHTAFVFTLRLRLSWQVVEGVRDERPVDRTARPAALSRELVDDGRFREVHNLVVWGEAAPSR